MNGVIYADDLEPIVGPAWSQEQIGARTPHAVTIAVADSEITVRFDDARCAALFSERYADQQVGGPAPLVHYVVHTTTGYLFWSPGGVAWTWARGRLGAGAVAFLADATAITALINSSPHLLTFHAAAVAIQGVAAAIAGDSGAGKTTSAIACARRGMGLYSDELCVLRGGKVMPFARTLHIRTGGLQLLALDAIDGELMPVRDGVNVRISTLFGWRAIPPPAPLRAVFLLSGREEHPELRRVAWFDVAPALIRSMESNDATPLQRIARVLAVLREVECFRLVLGPPDETALLVRRTLCALESCG